MIPLKLLLVSPHPPPNGGIGRWTVLLLGWLQGLREVKARHVDISPRWRAIYELGLVRRLIGGCLQGLRDTWRVVTFLARFRPDVLHLTTSGSLAGMRDIVLLLLARGCRCRSVYHIRIGRLPQLVGTSAWEWRLLHRAMRLADKVIVIEQAGEMALRSVLPSEKIVRIPNAIDLRKLEAGGKRQEPAGDGSIVSGPVASGPAHRRVLFLGWVIPTKGMRELMEAWRELEPQGWELVVAGPGNEMYRQELAGVAGTGGSVRFVGELSPAQAWQYLQQADVFVLPTYTEGFPNVILEAMAAGKAVVASRAGAIPEMLDADAPAPCGLVIEPRDMIALVGALRRVMTDEPLRLGLGRRARAKVERCYDTDIVFPKLLALWRDLAAKE